MKIKQSTLVMAGWMPALIASGLPLSGFSQQNMTTASRQRPNILWISTEDFSPHLGCYGDKVARTPNIDELASQGVLFSHVFTTAAISAPCREGTITG